MSSNEVNVESLCQNCVHHVFQSDQNMIWCKLLEESLVKGRTECEDWEELFDDESNQYECET
jgi:hypothetical protein